jgi:hypothetical protein
MLFQPTLHAEVESYFKAAPPHEVAKVETMDNDHGLFACVRRQPDEDRDS